MQIIITAKQFELGESFQTHIHDLIKKEISKYFDNIINVEVIFSKISHKHEHHFHRIDVNHTGLIDFEEFREIFIELCNLRKELEDRGIDVPTFTRKKTLKAILKELLIEAINIGVYTKYDYKTNPVKYCGMMITDSPLDL
jgi:ribosomal subunit interface protein